MDTYQHILNIRINQNISQNYNAYVVTGGKKGINCCEQVALGQILNDMENSKKQL